jgi:hypothetical protein
MKKLFAVASALVLAGLATPSQAALVVEAFQIAPGGWFGGGNPYGVGTNPALSGTVTLDNTDASGNTFKAINYITGSRTWTLADINIGASGAVFNAMGGVQQFSLIFGNYSSYVFSNNTAAINDAGGGGSIACNGCVSISPAVSSAVPEPAAWALMLVGFGVMGSAMRRRQRHAAQVSYA